MNEIEQEKLELIRFAQAALEMPNIEMTPKRRKKLEEFATEEKIQKLSSEKQRVVREIFKHFNIEVK